MVSAPTAQSGGRGGRRRTLSPYGVQLQEKQQLKGVYGIREAQLRKYYVEAIGSREQTGLALLRRLEQRIDNVVYRAGFAATRRQARQMASHKLFMVNGRVVSVPSVRVKKGDLVVIKESKRNKAYFSNFEKRMQNVALPNWLSLDVEGYGVKVTGDVDVAQAGIGVEVQSVVELLSR